jgi:Holliday junction DNA helicase RuvA
MPIRQLARYHADMISRIEGELLSAAGSSIELGCGELVYELLVPAIDTQRLAAMVGERISFHTLHYMEGQGQGTSFIPRLIGFRTIEDRAFFELFTTVKGFGNRKALRALELPFADIAAAIAAKDTDVLTALPEIGKRTAESIIAQLSGKVDRFIEIKDMHPAAQINPLTNDAIAVLVQLGESKSHARQLVDRALAADPSLDSPDALVAAAFRLKELA